MYNVVYRRKCPHDKGGDKVNPEPRTHAHDCPDGNKYENSGDEKGHRDGQPFGEQMGKCPISEEGGNECNPWEEKTQNKKPYW